MERNNITDKNRKLVLNKQINLIKQKKHEEDIIKTTELEEENKNRSLWHKIKSAWNWFYSGRIKAFIWRVLELWAKWTFLCDMADLLMLVTILTAIPFFAQIVAIYLSVKLLIFCGFVCAAIVDVVNESTDKKKAQAYIDKVDQEYYTGLDDIYKDSLLSKAGAKFVWQNFRGRIFDILVTSSCLLFIPTHITFILYCTFVAMSAFCFLKDVGIAIYWYLDIRNKHRCEKIAGLQENFLDTNPNHSITRIMAERQHTLDIDEKRKNHEKAKVPESRASNNGVNGYLDKSSVIDVGNKYRESIKRIKLSALHDMNKNPAQQLPGAGENPGNGDCQKISLSLVKKVSQQQEKISSVSIVSKHKRQNKERYE